jgi:RNA polymerase sigma-70 factor (ECF subfamily)
VNGLIDPVTNEPEPDHTLVERVRAGDVSALEDLYRRHVGLVHGLCLRMVGDEVRAEELTQDTWVRVWERLRGFEARSAFTTWLYRVATNVVLESERGRGRREVRESLAGEGADRTPPDAVVDRLVLERAILDLPPRARAVFLLHDIEGHSHAEIGRILDIASGTSRAQLFFAREKLRRELAE